MSGSGEPRGAAAPPPRIARVDWASVVAHLDLQGWALLPKLVTAAECRALVRLYADDSLFRSRVIMERHGYGRGEYKYFAAPLPPLVGALRAALYPALAPVANRWHELGRIDARFPPALDDFLARCHAAGQTRPTPLLLRYGPDDYNRMHQDLYGPHVFPLQITVLLAEPERDFTGGEFVLTEQRPRMQSRAEVVPLRRGDGVVFAVRDRPAAGPRGHARVAMRHGVSRVRSGQRFAMGLIFHDAA